MSRQCLWPGVCVNRIMARVTPHTRRLLRAALAVIPGQHQHHEEAHDHRQRDASAQTLRPAKLRRDDIQHGHQGHGHRRIAQQLLHQLVFFQSCEEFFHRMPPLPSLGEYSAGPPQHGRGRLADEAGMREIGWSRPS